jgi:predicted transcriptional regulator
MVSKNVIEEDFELNYSLTPIQNNLIKTLYNVGPLTRRELVKQLNTPRTTIYDNLLKLQKRKFIEKHTRNNGKRGRPLVIWKIKD